MSGTRALTGNAKKKDIERLLKLLENGDAGTWKNQADLLDILTQLKLYGRDIASADPIYCKSGISTLANYAFTSTTPTSKEALRCIANALLLAPNLRQDFIGLGLVQKAAERLKSEDHDDEFLISRIIFLLTYSTDMDQDEVLLKLSVASSINTHLLQHAQTYEASEDMGKSSGMAMMALSETLKLLFNLSVRQDNVKLFQPAIKPILSILGRIQLPSHCLDSPISLLINALVNLDLDYDEASEAIESSSKPQMETRNLVDRLIDMLERSLKEYKETELETSLPPLLTLLRKFYDFGCEDVRIHMEDTLLPLHEEGEVPIGSSDTLPSRLLRLSSSAMTPKLRELIPVLMFELSHQDPTKFINNIGYGFAAGFLASHNIAMPESIKQSQQPASSGIDKPPTNPITGQRLDKEPKDTGPPMTMEEKEREAERLFVLFERLKATGVVNVQNPVQQMVSGGKQGARIEEVDDSD